MRANISLGTFAVKTAHKNHQLCQKTVECLISLLCITFRLLIDFKTFFFVVPYLSDISGNDSHILSVSKTISFPVISSENQS